MPFSLPLAKATLFNQHMTVVPVSMPRFLLVFRLRKTPLQLTGCLPCKQPFHSNPGETLPQFFLLTSLCFLRGHPWQFGKKFLLSSMVRLFWFLYCAYTHGKKKSLQANKPIFQVNVFSVKYLKTEYKHTSKSLSIMIKLILSLKCRDCYSVGVKI